jgi:hypothetical protein
MQTAQLRRLTLAPDNVAIRGLVLAVVFALSAGVLTVIDRQPNAYEARWPEENSLFAVDGWSASPANVELQNSTYYIIRNYSSAAGRAQVSITTSAEAKRVYRAGATIPFEGNGFTVDQVPPSLVSPSSGRSAVLVRRESEVGLLLYAYGERRGLVGNGIPGWALVALDSVIGRPNDYYLLRVYAPLSDEDASTASVVAALADTLFARVAAWYGV